MPRQSQHAWFRAKRYGWGWGLPARWQGWVVLTLFLVLVVGGGFFIDSAVDVLVYLAAVLALSVGLLAVCWITGERPRWRWGEDDE